MFFFLLQKDENFIILSKFIFERINYYFCIDTEIKSWQLQIPCKVSNKNKSTQQMERAKSFSKNGINLDVNFLSATKKKDNQSLQRVLKSKNSILVKDIKLRQISSTQQKPIIFRTIPRNTLSSFQKCHTKEQNINAIYNLKIQITKKKHQHFSMKKFNPPSYFETVSQWYKKQHEENDACGKLTKTMRSEKWIATESMNNKNYSTLNSSSNKLLIPFEKQTQRPFYQRLRKLESQSILKPFPTDQVDAKRKQAQRHESLKKTRRFQCYSHHDLLNPQKIATFTSQMNSHKVELTKYKSKNQSSHLKFDKFVNKIMTRFDRDCDPWVAKLQYECGDNLVKSEKEVRNFDRQTDRKLNEVHSKYPIRLAM